MIETRCLKHVVIFIQPVKKSYGKYRKIINLSLILTLMNFVFNCTQYLQTMGYAMGTICAPSYVNIFMVTFEAKRIYPYIKEISLLYLDYIFMIWGTKAELMAFIKELNKKHKISNLTLKFHQEKLHFLMQCYNAKIKITSKQLYITNLQISKHSYTLNHNI